MPMDPRAYTWRPEKRAVPAPGRGPLSGLRLAVKDLFHIAGIPTGAGNPDWLASHPLPTRTAPVVAQLLSAGAELVGKTLTDELAYSLNGQNIHYGTPLNPRAKDRLPGGSSSGSAVVVAAGEADIGLGTDTGGSIRVPASYNGLFGLRPTHGELSLEETVPLAPRFDTVGWMTNTAALLKRVGDILLPEDLPTRSNNGSATLAVLVPEQGGQPLWREEHDAWLQSLDTSAVVLRRIEVNGDWLNHASDCFRTLQGREIWRTHGRWLTERKPVFAPDIQARLQWSRGLTEADEVGAERDRAQLCATIASWFEGVEAVLMPTTPGPAPRLDAASDRIAVYRSQLMGLTAPAGLCSLPQLHMPVLARDGAPMGVSLLGAHRHDKVLLELAHTLTETRS
ncbi:amidase [Marinimicrobium agarilyticum]|uniref:amidase n=1 Tax=Marinimicrobium agarilyticum TaxID=306546 RepID=UPI0004848BFB|nr:amidase [Marinimicrobium agarilyticum]